MEEYITLAKGQLEAVSCSEVGTHFSAWYCGCKLEDLGLFLHVFVLLMQTTPPPLCTEVSQKPQERDLGIALA